MAGKKFGIWKMLGKGMLFVFSTLALSIVLYTLFALVFSTDTEKRLKRENRMYAKMYPILQPKEEMLNDVITGLQIKDGSIYGEVFHTIAPDVDPMASAVGIHGSDTIPDERFVVYTARKADGLMASAHVIDSCFARILLAVADKEFEMPPMQMPLKEISYMQVGASKGRRLNPFYKTYVQHDGVDFLVPQATPVYAPAAGVVSKVVHSNKGDGNVVEITHKGGYVTKYMHLSEMMVGKGQTVSCGQRIASVGMSGNSFAPHLHYEVHKDGTAVDPMGHIFASVAPEDYPNMLFMAVKTVQSMD